MKQHLLQLLPLPSYQLRVPDTTSAPDTLEWTLCHIILHHHQVSFFSATQIRIFYSNLFKMGSMDMSQDHFVKMDEMDMETCGSYQSSCSADWDFTPSFVQPAVVSNYPRHIRGDIWAIGYVECSVGHQVNKMLIPHVTDWMKTDGRRSTVQLVIWTPWFSVSSVNRNCGRRSGHSVVQSESRVVLWWLSLIAFCKQKNGCPEWWWEKSIDQKKLWRWEQWIWSFWSQEVSKGSTDDSQFPDGLWSPNDFSDRTIPMIIVSLFH